MAQFEALAAGDPRQVGRYRVLARLGAGGMGRVFLARSPGGRPVAVKVVRAHLAEDPEFRRRFAREVAAARMVNSFFTAGVVDADTDGSPPWLATAYVAGMSLSDAVAEHGRWPEASVRALGAGLAEALEAIHAAGLVHRDLKPSNVLLAADGPRVIDFGISRAAEGTALTQTGATVGTPGYIAPEQLLGAGAGPVGDVFALGAVLVYAATGEGPFGTGLAQEVNFRAAYEPAELGGVPEALRELVGRCLAKDPGERLSLGELMAALTAADSSAADSSAALEWLPDPVARAVSERSESSLPSTPPAPPPPPYAPPPAAPVTGAFGPPVPAGPPGRPPGAGTSRRRLLAFGGGAGALAGLGVLGYLLTSSDGSGGSGGSGGGNGGNSSAGIISGGTTSSGVTGGTGPSESSVPATTVRIAVQAPLTGDNAALGQSMLQAAQLAVDEANADGGYPGYRFEIAEADDQGTEDQATPAAQQAIDDDSVLAVVGPAFSGPVMVAGALYDEAGLAAVSPSATNSTLTEQDFDTFLRAVPNDRQAGTGIGDVLAELGAGTVMVIDDTTAYGTDLADGVAERLGERGVTVLRESVPEGTVDYGSTAGAVAASGADAVAYLGYYADAGPFARSLVDEGFTGIRIAPDGVMDQEFMTLAGTASEGWYLVCSCYDASVSSDGRDFADRYEQAYGEEPGWYSPRAYDVTTMIIETVAALEPAEADRARVFEELADVRYDGIAGEIRFDGRGEFAGTGSQLYRVNGGSFAALGPVEDFRD